MLLLCRIMCGWRYSLDFLFNLAELCFPSRFHCRCARFMLTVWSVEKEGWGWEEGSDKQSHVTTNDSHKRSRVKLTTTKGHKILAISFCTSSFRSLVYLQLLSEQISAINLVAVLCWGFIRTWLLVLVFSSAHKNESCKWTQLAED